MKFFKDLGKSNLSWTEIFSYLRWRFFRSYLEDDIVLISEE